MSSRPSDLRVPVAVFFALRPPRGAVTAIEELTDVLQAAHDLEGRPIRGERIHATLAEVDVRGSLEEGITRALGVGDSIRYPAFPLRFNRTGSFAHKDGRYPFTLQGDGDLKHLGGFRRYLGARMTGAGLSVSRHFTPHITMMWTHRCVEEYPVAPIGWMVREFVLVASLKGMSRHILLGRWPLQDGSGPESGDQA